MIMSWISPLVQNFVQIFCADLPIWVKYNSIFWFFSEHTANVPKLIVTQNMPNDAVPCKDVPFGGGFENKN